MVVHIASGPTIVTASWYSALPKEFVRVGVSRGAPRRHPAGYRRYPPLYPGPWYGSVSDHEYVRRYEHEVLARLDPRHVLADLRRIGAGAPTALLCFERPGTGDGWCHRSLVVAWLDRELGLAVPEYGHEHLPPGQHPMLPPHLQQVHAKRGSAETK